MKVSVIRMIAERGGELYSFVIDGLERLKDKHRLFIVSNCQSGYIETFLNYAQLHHLFADFECFGNTGRSKAENIRALMERNAVKSAVYVGDTLGDQAAAEKTGLPFAYVSYGFGECTTFHWKFESFEKLTNHFDSGTEFVLHA